MVDSKINIEVFLFFAVLASCMIGAQVFGVSFAKIALVPLELFLLFRLKKLKVRLNKEKKMLLTWFGLVLVSSFLNFVVTDSPLKGYKTLLLLNIAQTLFFHIPILFMLGGERNIFDKMKRFVMIVAKINCVWSIVQFIAWYIFRFDFNRFFFIDVLHGFLGSREWTAWYNDSLSIAIRPTGLNHDPAFLSLLLVIGFILVESKFWKYLFFIGTVAAMSRVGIVSIVIFFFYEKCKTGVLKINFKKAISGFFVSFAFVFFSVWLYNNNVFVENQVDKIGSRLVSIIGSEHGDGTDRHIMYFPTAVKASIEMPVFNQLFGVGTRAGGNAYILTETYKQVFSLNKAQQTETWSVECDPAELLLGMGVLGFVLYYYIMIYFMRKYRKKVQDQAIFLMLIIFGIMYNVSMHPLITLLLMTAAQQSRDQQYCLEGEYAV